MNILFICISKYKIKFLSVSYYSRTNLKQRANIHEIISLTMSRFCIQFNFSIIRYSKFVQDKYISPFDIIIVHVLVPFRIVVT